MKQRLMIAFALAACPAVTARHALAQTSNAPPSANAAAVTPVTTPSQEPRHYWLVVTGLSGEAEYAVSYAATAQRIAAAARDRFGAAQVWWLAEAGTPGATSTSTRANIEAKVREVAEQSTPDDAFFVIMIGHGSAAESPRIGLPGPDLSAGDLAGWLSAVRARVTIVNTASTSGAWIAPLAAKGRIVVTATKSGVEQNETTFARYFADALTIEGADTDKDNRVSVLEAFSYAKREVERAYTADKKMLTEHAQIDGDGDGKAVAVATADSPDGAIAGLTHFGVIGTRPVTPGDAALPLSPALRALYSEKAALERRLSDLRAKKADMPDTEYQAQLEKLLTDIAVNGQSIRKLEAAK